jgi:glucose/arabinose dehydrogenase/mono/diheme cytochrome c family protein
MGSNRSRRHFARALVLIAAVPLAATLLSGSTQSPPTANGAANPQPWADWIEPDFPFFSSVLDAGKAGNGLPPRNLSPRALILNLGNGLWAAFDTDLLRVAAIWKGNGVTPAALGPGSYQTPDRKTQGGQTGLPAPDGTVWLATSIYPGWQASAQPSFDDPREPAPTVEEVGRGPIAEGMGRFKAVRLVGKSAVLEYQVRGTDVREWITSGEGGDRSPVIRNIEVAPSNAALWLMLGSKRTDVSASLCSDSSSAATLETVRNGTDDVLAIKLAPHTTAARFCVAVGETGTTARVSSKTIPSDAPIRRWPQEVTTAVTRSTANDAFVVDDYALPTTNPWRRNVRPGDIQFLKDGTGVSVTLDGDVWLVRGLNEAAGPVRWKRFGSGLHEPLTLAIRDEQIYVFDRNGIWRLRDTNGDGEADVHELFSNAFAQTADMREFPSEIRLAPNGEFIIAKGGQEATTIGKHNGSVLRVSADGKTSTVLGYGFRQPNIGVNIKTGLVTASDQQGHYIPSTPLHIVGDKQFYGFLSDKLPREVYPAPIAEPLTWIPHAVNASAMSQVWLFNARMGPLTDNLVHIGFNNPELFRVLLNERGKRLQAAVVSITRAFPYPPMHGSVNPIDGQLYIAGFQVLGWGTTSTRLAGLGRVRATGTPFTVPKEIAPMDKGVLIRFDVPLDRTKAVDPDSYTITAWNYQRTYRYGSPQFKADGTVGIDRLAPSSAYLSKDGKTVFVGIPEIATIKRPMQMRVGWSLKRADGAAFEENASFTPYELTPFDPIAEGFGTMTVNLTPRPLLADTSAPISVEEGRRVYQRYGCIACHASEPTSISKLGPNFWGVYGSSRTFNGGIARVTADDGYIRESILEPSAKVVSGFEKTGMGMPSFGGVLTDPQIESVILFIKSLK